MHLGMFGLLLGLLRHKVAGESVFRSVVVMEDALGLCFKRKYVVADEPIC
jgi:hypothetical protein